jgi:lipopolysaccharide export LptBFGC system permease protein LptF
MGILLRNYYLKKIEYLFLLTLCFFLIFLLTNKTIATFLYFQYFLVNNWDIAKIILFRLLGSMEGLFSFCAAISILITTKQLSKSSELTSYFTQGISANFVFLTVARFTITLGIFSFLMVAWARPIFFEKSENLIKKIVHEANFHFQPQQFNPIGDYFFYFQSQEGKTLSNLLLFRQQDPLNSQIISAQKGNIKSVVSESLFIFELENGEVLSLDSNTNQQMQFSYLLQPIKITQTIQLQNIETRVLEKRQKHDQYNFLDLYQKYKLLKTEDLEESRYYFTRLTFLITRSMHNTALPLIGLVLGFFFARFQPRFLYLKFFFFYIFYYFLVIQIEESTLEGIIPLWCNFILPILTIILSYYFFRKKV